MKGISIMKRAEAACKYIAIFVVIGVLSHIYALCNFIFNRDTICLTSTNYDWILSQGKWFVTPITSIYGPVVVPFLSNTLGVLYIAIALYLIINLFKIRNNICRIVLAVMFYNFPSVATMMIYQDVYYFGFSILLATLSAYFILKPGYNKLIGIMAGVFAIASYQPYVSVILVILLTKSVYDLIKNGDIKQIFVSTCKSIFCTAISTLVYYVILRMILSIKGVELSNYKGVSNMSQNLLPKRLFNSGIVAYIDYLKWYFKDSLGLSIANCWNKTNVLLLITIVILLIALLVCKKISKTNFAFVILWMTLFPLVANSIGILSANASFYYISIFSFVCTYLLPIILVEHILYDVHLEKVIFSTKCFSISVMGILLLVSANWFVQNNTTYYKAVIMDRECNFKLGVLASQIVEIDDYSEKDCVIIVGSAPYNFMNSSGVLRRLESNYTTAAYGMPNSAELICGDGMINNYLTNTISADLNIVVDNEVLEKYSDDIEKMSIYPNDGSIKRYDNKIVVKLGNSN